MRGRVHLPPDRDRPHLRRERRKKPRQLEFREVCRPKRNPGALLVTVLHGAKVRRIARKSNEVWVSAARRPGVHASDTNAMLFARLFDPFFLLFVVLSVAVFALRSQLAPTPRARRRWFVLVGVVAVLGLLSMPAFAFLVYNAYEAPAVEVSALRGTLDPARTAIAVLSSSSMAPVPGVPATERLDSVCTARTVGAARVYRALQPRWVIVSGRTAGPVADVTVRAMEELLVQGGVPRDRVVRDPDALNTRQNAQNSAALARARGADTVVVVTSAVHLRRSLFEFRRAGIRAVGAPVDFLGHVSFTPWHLFPTSGVIGRFDAVLHEVLGFLRP